MERPAPQARPLKGAQQSWRSGTRNHSNNVATAPGGPRLWGAPAKGCMPGPSLGGTSSLPPPVVALLAPLYRRGPITGLEPHVTQTRVRRESHLSPKCKRISMPSADPGGGRPGALLPTLAGRAPSAANGRA